MTDKIPVYAGTRPDGTFVYSKEFGTGDGIDSKKISYDTVGNNYLINDNPSDNVDVIDSKLTEWEATAWPVGIEWPSLHVYNDVTTQVYPCDTDITIPYNKIQFDNANTFNLTTKKYVVPITGYYDIQAMTQIDGSTIGNYKNSLVGLRLMIDDLFKISGERYTNYNNDVITPNWRYVCRRTLSSIEYLTAGQTVHIAWYRSELVDYPCVSNSGLYTYQSKVSTEYFQMSLISV